MKREIKKPNYKLEDIVIVRDKGGEYDDGGMTFMGIIVGAEFRREWIYCVKYLYSVNNVYNYDWYAEKNITNLLTK